MTPAESGMRNALRAYRRGCRGDEGRVRQMEAVEQTERAPGSSAAGVLGESVTPVPTPTHMQPPAVVKFHTPEVIIGRGALESVAEVAIGLGMSRPLVVSDATVRATAWHGELDSSLRRLPLAVSGFSDVSPNPRAEEVGAAFTAYLDHGADGVIALGGGSVIDAAKGVAIMATNGGHILRYEGIDRARLPLPPVIAAPTTAGSGSDVSQFCIINDSARGTKVTIVGRSLVPDVSIVDPRVLQTVSPAVTAQSGMDVVSHCVEAYVSLAHSRMTDGLALQALSMAWSSLARLVDNPADPEAGLDMAYATLKAGMAFTNAILGATHAMSHPVGGRCDAAHGAINSVLLPHVIRYNAQAHPARYAELGDAIGIDTTGSPRVVADRLADAVESLAQRVGMPARLADLGVVADDIPMLATLAMRDACMTTNPRLATTDEIAQLYREAL